MVKKKVFFQNKKFVIEECENGDIIVDNVRYSPQVKKGPKNTYKVKLNDKLYTIEIEKEKIFLDGAEVKFSIKPYIELKGGEKADEEEEIVITAPIPGKISQVLVKKGEKVSANQELIILEAMKMRNRILSPMEGVVEEIYVNNDINVQQDQKLVKIVHRFCT